eukprot:6645805-Lingulodinium_polyedra.AAC.1
MGGDMVIEGVCSTVPRPAVQLCQYIRFSIRPTWHAPSQGESHGAVQILVRPIARLPFAKVA